MIKAKDEVEEVLGQPDIPLSAAQRLTERRTLAAPPGRTSRKGALWLRRHLQNAPFRDVKPQNALFLTWANAASAHGKAHSVLMDSRKSAFCDRHRSERRSLELRLMEKRTLLAWGLQTALFRHVAARESWDATPRQPAGHYGEWPNWANALEQPPARLRGGCAGARRPRPGARLYGKAQSGQRASLRARPGPGRDTIGLPVVG